MSYISGALVLNGVPHAAVAASNLPRLQTEEVGFVFKATMGAAFVNLSLMMLFIAIASAVHREVRTL